MTITEKDLRRLYKAETGSYPGKPTSFGSVPPDITLSHQTKEGLLDYIKWLEQLLITNKINVT